MKTSVIIVAAGMGRRMKSETTKQLIEIGDKPILWHTLKAFQDISDIDEMIVVAKEDEIVYIKKSITCEFNKVISVVAGGMERADSVYNGIRLLGDDVGWVLIHDGARPFITRQAVERLLVEVKKSNAAVLGVPVKDTIKSVDRQGRIRETYNRSELWAVQTPQAFKKELIISAFREKATISGIIYDDAMLVEMTQNVAVQMVKGDERNIKITTPYDLAVGKVIYNDLLRSTHV